MKHTPGPWKASDRETRVIAVKKKGFRPSASYPEYTIAQTFSFCGAGRVGNKFYEEAAANARLIAAAPEMFEFIKYVAETTVADKYAHWKTQCQAMVAKIEGTK